MTLPDVSTGDPHVNAHNTERHKINAESPVLGAALTVDWNTLTSAGEFLMAAAQANAPVSTGLFVLEVTTASASTSVVQEAMALDGTSRWIRVYTSGAFGAWLPVGDSRSAIRIGTGSPEGVVTAAIGVGYIDLNTTNGAFRWQKKTGTGNTGWVVVDGDTGWRDITSLLTVAPASGTLQIRRRNNTTMIRLIALNYAAAIATGQTLFTVPVGFRPYANFVTLDYIYVANSALKLYVSTTICFTAFTYGTGGSGLGYPANINPAGYSSYETFEAWPTTLPGTASS